MRQRLPIIPMGAHSEVVAATISHDLFWASVQSLKLTNDKRLRDPAGEEVAAFANRLLITAKATRIVGTAGSPCNRAVRTHRLYSGPTVGSVVGSVASDGANF